MTAISRSFSKDIAHLFEVKSSGLLKSRLTPFLAIKCLQQLAQNFNFCKKNSDRVATVCQYVTEGVLSGLISWNEISKTLTIVARFHGYFFYLEGAKDLTLTSINGKDTYSRLLLMFFSINLRKRWEEKPLELELHYSKIIPLIITSSDFHALYQTFTYPCFGHAYLFSTELLRRAILQCQQWGYKGGVDAYQRILIERLDNVGDVLSEYNFAVENGLSLVIEHCRSFFEKHPFYINEVEGKTYYLANSVLIEAPFLENIMPSDRERRLFCRGQTEYGGNLHLTDMQVESIEFILNKMNVEVTRKIINWFQFTDLKKQIQSNSLKTGRLSINTKTLVLNGKDPITNKMILGLLRLYSFAGIDFVRHLEVSIPLLESISRINPNLNSLRIIQCPLVGLEVKDRIPSLFPKLTLFSLNGGLLPQGIIAKYLCLPLTSLLLTACVVEWPEDLSGLEKLHTLELTFVKISENDLNRLLKTIEELKRVIMVGIKAFKISMLCHHCLNLENITISASSLDGEGLHYLARFCRLKTLFIEGDLSPSIRNTLLELVERKKLQISFIGTW